ncbi:CheR family methyltransferase [Marinibacterium profundimaris]|uniref:protein-glutamate O-methyltransferase n=1 Tax=Marinibacterium profundimaris TaxID=1679460 RepID=A0A225NJE4_9RHOB|nr:protein-glutamate O-methyltransferase CheR [Marinibacterium profundimaris]OWU72281.1 hypothetical protein ATO3_17210 [Marinibacterium profundimaris]
MTFMQGPPPAQSELTPDLARAIVSRAEQISGIRIDAGKLEFVRLRVGRRLVALGLDSFRVYHDFLARDSGGEEVRHLVEALTTHTTSFFREQRHYDWLEEEGIDCLLEGRDRSPFVVWSAATSIGAELWSAGMILAERNAAGRPPADWQLIGTDISERILQRAVTATYSEEEIPGISPARAGRFLLRSRKLRDRNGFPVYRIAPDLRARARFQKANLQDLKDLANFTADIVFLRNVLIYFDEEGRDRVVSNVASRLRPGGILFTGHAEALGSHPAFETLRPTIYRKV